MVERSTAAVSNIHGVYEANAGRSLTDKHLYKVAAGHGEKRHACFARDSLRTKVRDQTAVDGSSHALGARLRGVAYLGQQRFAGAGRADEQRTSWWLRRQDAD